MAPVPDPRRGTAPGAGLRRGDPARVPGPTRAGTTLGTAPGRRLRAGGDSNPSARRALGRPRFRRRVARPAAGSRPSGNVLHHDRRPATSPGLGGGGCPTPFASPTSPWSTRDSRTMPGARRERRSMSQRRGRSGHSPSSPNSDFPCSRSAASSSFREGNPILRSSSRQRSPASSSVVGSTRLSPTRARRLTGSVSSLSWQRSLRPPPASPGDRACRRELRSVSSARTSAS